MDLTILAFPKKNTLLIDRAPKQALRFSRLLFFAFFTHKGLLRRHHFLSLFSTVEPSKISMKGHHKNFGWIWRPRRTRSSTRISLVVFYVIFLSHSSKAASAAGTLPSNRQTTTRAFRGGHTRDTTDLCSRESHARATLMELNEHSRGIGLRVGYGSRNEATLMEWFSQLFFSELWRQRATNRCTELRAFWLFSLYFFPKTD